MTNKLITDLSNLKMKRRYLLRQLDGCGNNVQKRKEVFELLKQVDLELRKTRFKIEMERKIYENNNTN